jgi:hypothetical protein
MTNVRNFWIEAKIDGRSTDLSGGPQSAVGGFELTVFVRNEGASVQALHLIGNADSEGRLTLDLATYDPTNTTGWHGTSYDNQVKVLETNR